MKPFAVILFLVLIPGLSTATKPTPRELPVADPAAAGMSPEKLQLVGDKVRSLIHENRIAGASVMVTRNGKIVYSETFGLRDIENNKPMESDTIFRIYSMTKAVTSVAAMMLVERGALRLEDAVSKYLPEFKNAKVWKDGREIPPKAPATIKDLLCHTSGYSYGNIGIQAIDEAHKENGSLLETIPLSKFCRQAALIPMAFEPGERWLYGISTDLLGAVVEQVSDMTLDRFFQSQIFTPLGMVDTGFVIPEDKRWRLAAAYDSNKKGTLNFNLTTT